MKTSYYAKAGKDKNAVSISAKPPAFYRGKVYTKLAPNWSIWEEWKYSEKTEEEKNKKYTERFKKEILAKLDPVQVHNELGEDAILLCYEKSGSFCHRHIVAEWLSTNLGISIEEV